MIAPDGRKVSAVYLSPEMISDLLRAYVLHSPGRIAAVAIDGRIFFRLLDSHPRDVRKLWKRHPEMMIPESSGYRMETREISLDDV